MVPGRQYSVGIVGRLLWKRRWMIALPLIALTGAAVALSRSLPNTYRAETTILLVAQRVPESYVRTTVTTRLEERLRTISQHILSRTRLEGLIREFNLYSELREKLLMEQVVEHMRPNVTIEPSRETSFRLAFTYGDPVVAAKVVERLATAFIEENLRDRELQADSTSRFLEAQLNDARRRLIEQEKRLEEYRKANSGSLPSQLGSNMQMMQTSQQTLTMLSDATNRLRDRRAVVETQLAEQRQAATAAAPPPPQPAAAPGAGVPGAVPMTGTPAQQLETAKQNLQGLQLRLQPQHPDVQRALRQVADLEAQVKVQAQHQPAERPALPPAVTPAQVAAQNRVRELEAERAAIDRQIAYNEAEDRRLRGTIASYQGRLEQLPTRESELTELTRDYNTLQATYQDLLSKREQSVVAANLERRQIGEQFRVIDPARVPEVPVSPNRMMINAAGLVFGLLFGLGTALVLEIFNTTLRTDREVGTALGLPALALVPVLATRTEERRQKRLARLEFGLVTGVVLVATGVAVWVKFVVGT